MLVQSPRVRCGDVCVHLHGREYVSRVVRVHYHRSRRLSRRRSQSSHVRLSVVVHVEHNVEKIKRHRVHSRQHAAYVGVLRLERSSRVRAEREGGSRVWRGRNRTASRQRAFIGILKDGTVDFGYGELTPDRAKAYDMFVGGLHSIYNDLEEPPESYKGAYSISMGQRIRYYLPRIRMVYGLKADGRIEMLMSKDGLTLEQTKDLARRRGLVAAYMPDHASKSRLIIPGVKGFTEEDANWISGGATSFVHVPYLLRLSERRVRLEGGLIADLTRRIETSQRCEGASDCAFFYGGQLMDRALAGLNRVMEQGVEPIARMIWAPKPSPRLDHNQTTPVTEIVPTRQPLREPPITADPLVLRERSDVESEQDDLSNSDAETQPWDFDLPPDLPPPVLLQEDQILPEDPEAWPEPIPPTPGLSEEESVSSAEDEKSIIYGAPPPPVLPPPPLP